MRRLALPTTPAFCYLFILGALAVVSTFGLIGCAGEGQGNSGSGATALGRLQQEVFTPTCATAGCHDAITQTFGLNMATATLSATSLVNRAALGCAGKTLVVPGDPEASYLIDKLAGATTPCGSLMPLGFPQLDSAELDLVRSWIAGGATTTTSPVSSSTTTSSSTSSTLGSLERATSTTSTTTTLGTGL
ncbi:MAG: hypothetical protein ACE5D3_03425 [Candidatus Binatia bacterium]